jgi:hypothetical protein
MATDQAWIHAAESLKVLIGVCVQRLMPGKSASVAAEILADPEEAIVNATEPGPERDEMLRLVRGITIPFTVDPEAIEVVARRVKDGEDVHVAVYKFVNEARARDGLPPLA